MGSSWNLAMSSCLERFTLNTVVVTVDRQECLPVRSSVLCLLGSDDCDVTLWALMVWLMNDPILDDIQSHLGH